MRILPVAETTLLAELADLDETLALFASLDARPAPGVEEIVPAARTLMIRWRPGETSPEGLAGDLRSRALNHRPAPSEREVEVPVHYDGEDLAEVAALLGCSRDEVVRRHTASTFTVAFTGFAPGFGYLVGGDPGLHVPRRQSPRTRIPAGAVAIAGPFSGVYPQASPGGWQIIGTTPLPMWDLSRDPPALFQPGTRVRFVDLGAPGARPWQAPSRPAVAAPPALALPDRGLRILEAPMPALFQDLGRPGQTGQGVSASGALDRGALHAANRCVGNPAGTPGLEISLGGFAFEAIGRLTVAFAGAECAVTVRDAAGRAFAAATYRPIALEPGDRVELGRPTRGVRSYLAVRGGFDVTPVLASASTDTLARIGPEPVTVGARLAVRAASTGWDAVSLDEAPPRVLPARGDIVALDVTMGPRTDWFTARGIAALSDQLWDVTPQSSRVGMRLAGATALERIDAAELPSEGTATGAIQVPHSGQPVLFLADHPLTGGYPVIAVLAGHHLDLAAQIPAGARIRFRPITSFAEIAPLPAA